MKDQTQLARMLLNIDAASDVTSIALKEILAVAEAIAQDLHPHDVATINVQMVHFRAIADLFHFEPHECEGLLVPYLELRNSCLNALDDSLSANPSDDKAPFYRQLREITLLNFDWGAE